MSQAGTAGVPSPGTVPAPAPRTASCHKVPRARAKRAVDPADRHGQARGRADSEIAHLAALGALQGPAESGKIPGRHPPGARRQILAGQVTDVTGSTISVMSTTLPGTAVQPAGSR